MADLLTSSRGSLYLLEAFGTAEVPELRRPPRSHLLSIVMAPPMYQPSCVRCTSPAHTLLSLVLVNNAPRLNSATAHYKNTERISREP